MQSIGQFLQKQRRKKNLTREEIATELNVSVSFLQHLEEDHFKLLPAPVYVKGFLRRYAKYLGLQEKHLLALFRRSYDLQQQDHSAPPQPLQRPHFTFTPGRVFSLVISLTIIAFLGLLYFQYRRYSGQPVLVLQTPPEESIIYQEYVEVSGQTEPGVELFINGEKKPLEEDGTFRFTLGLEPGLNNIVITVRKGNGKETTVRRQVEVVNPAP